RGRARSTAGHRSGGGPCGPGGDGPLGYRRGAYRYGQAPTGTGTRGDRRGEGARKVTSQAPKSARGGGDGDDALFAAEKPTLGPTGRPVREIPEPGPVQRHPRWQARILAMCNQKGGVGKTTSTINLGAALAEYGRRVLLVDLDPQGALSAGLGVAHHELDNTVYNLLVERGVDIDDVVMRTRVDGLDLLPSN